jgi:hypothetical protein
MSDSDPTNLRELIDAIPDLVEYGTVAVGADGQITLPKHARTELRLGTAGTTTCTAPPCSGW